jgi:ribosome biogenesis SPOUT family RNA methylase Rps3
VTKMSSPTDEYLRKHGIEARLQQAVSSLGADQPSNPYAALAAYLAAHGNQVKAGAEAEGGAAGERPSGRTGLLDSTEGASTTQYVAPQSTAGVGVVGSSVADVQLDPRACTIAAGFPRTRTQGPTYIVEHLEQPDADGARMSPWCKCEYMHMYDRVGGEKLLFTNMDGASAAWLRGTEGPRAGAPDLRIEARTVAQMCRDGDIADKSRVCLLDLRGEQPLSPADAKHFDYVLLGGLLGDDPPCGDITGLLREEGFQMRHLDERQMPTNIALIVCDKILTDGCLLSELPFVDDVQLDLFGADDGDDDEFGVSEVTQLPFRYLCDAQLCIYALSCVVSLYACVWRP